MTKHRRSATTTLAVVLVLAPAVAGLSVWTETDRIVPEGVSGHAFGISMDTDEETGTLVVGDSGAGPHGDGRAFVYQRGSTGWTQTAILSSGSFQAEAFGDAVAVDGDRILVGDREAGSAGFSSDGAYIFERGHTGEWTLVDLIEPPENVIDEFGQSVALEGDTAVIGTPVVHTREDRGAYVYEPNDTGDWTLRAHLLALDSPPRRHYGISVDIGGDLVAVGAPGADPQKDGGVDLFRRTGSGWVQEAHLGPPSFPTGEPNGENLGWSVDVEGDRVIAGDPTAVTGGHAVVYHESGSGSWSIEATLLPTDPEPVDFGWAVALEDRRALVGDPAATEVGSAYVFQRDGTEWRQEARLVPEEVQLWDFGDNVHLHGGTAFVADSDARDLSSPAGPGTVYTFEKADLAIDGPVHGSSEEPTAFIGGSEDPW